MPAGKGGILAQGNKGAYFVIARRDSACAIFPRDLGKGLPAKIVPPDNVGLSGCQLVQSFFQRGVQLFGVQLILGSLERLRG